MINIILLVIIFITVIIFLAGLSIPILNVIHNCKNCKTGCKKFLGLFSLGCQCLDNCSNNGKCDSKTGNCLCNTGFSGDNCSNCATNYYPKGKCDIFCDKNKTCNNNGICSSTNGKCSCRPGFIGDNCVKETIAQKIKNVGGDLVKHLESVCPNYKNLDDNTLKILYSDINQILKDGVPSVSIIPDSLKFYNDIKEKCKVTK